MAAERQLFVLLQQPGFEPLATAAHLAITIGSCGGKVTLFVLFGALQTLCGKRSYADEPSAQRSQALGLPDPRHMLGEGRKAIGVRIVTTEPGLKLAGLEPDQVRPYVDEITGLSTIWKQAEGAQLLSL